MDDDVGIRCIEALASGLLAATCASTQRARRSRLHARFQSAQHPFAQLRELLVFPYIYLNCFTPRGRRIWNALTCGCGHVLPELPAELGTEEYQDHQSITENRLIQATTLSKYVITSSPSQHICYGGRASKEGTISRRDAHRKLKHRSWQGRR